MLLRGVSLAAILGLIVTASATWWVQRALSPVGDGDGDGDGGARLVAFEIEPGDTMGRVALELEAEGLIRNSRVTRWFAKVEDLGSRLKVGEYELSDAQSTPEILAVLVEGRVQTHPISIPEGLRASEIADRLAAAGLADRQAFLEVVFDPDSPTRFGVDGPSLEGYLYPDTYRFARGLPAGRVAGAMITEFLDVYHQIAPGSDGVVAQGRKLSMRGLVTLASIVEKETGV
ncbi:MAG: hypothetical protein CL908_12865, partial [Deltaproteobacteria bacterium]|nr:hypothetical protein [Deltaproteobacteria bacterium]